MIDMKIKKSPFLILCMFCSISTSIDAAQLRVMNAGASQQEYFGNSTITPAQASEPIAVQSISWFRNPVTLSAFNWSNASVKLDGSPYLIDQGDVSTSIGLVRQYIFNGINLCINEGNPGNRWTLQFLGSAGGNPQDFLAGQDVRVMDCP